MGVGCGGRGGLEGADVVVVLRVVVQGVGERVGGDVGVVVGGMVRRGVGDVVGRASFSYKMRMCVEVESFGSGVGCGQEVFAPSRTTT